MFKRQANTFVNVNAQLAEEQTNYLLSERLFLSKALLEENEQSDNCGQLSTLR